MEIVYSKDSIFTWGIDSLDNRFGRPDERELIILFGFMSSWKTEFAYFVARKNLAIMNKILFLSLELPEYDMKLRIARKSAWVSKINFQNWNFSDQQKQIMDDKFKEIENMKDLFIVSPEDKSLWALIDLMRKWYDKWIRLFIIDNLDKIPADDREDENRRYQRITSTLQDFKNESGICIILLHHAKKPESKGFAYKRAGMAGLRGSQKILDNATQVFEIYRDLDPDIDEIDRGKVEIIQYKDTAEWANGTEAIYFHKWDYVEKRKV